MNFYTLAGLVMSGTHPTVQFSEKIEDLEAYPEPRMRAEIIAAERQHDGVIVLTFDYTKYDEYNKQFESTNYYDRGGIACLTAREAGMYTPIEHIYLMGDDDVEGYLEDVQFGAVYDAYVKSGAKTSYVAWMEQIVATVINDC